MNKKVLLGLMAACLGVNAFAATEIYVKASTGKIVTMVHRGIPLLRPYKKR